MRAHTNFRNSAAAAMAPAATIQKHAISCATCDNFDVFSDRCCYNGKVKSFSVCDIWSVKG